MLSLTPGSKASVAFLFVLLSPFAASAQDKSLSLRQTLGPGVRFAPETPSVSWDQEKELLIIKAAGEGGAIQAREPATWAQREVSEEARQAAERRARSAGRRGRGRRGAPPEAQPDPKKVSLTRRRRQEDYLLTVPGKEPRVIGERGEREAHLSPDRKSVSYVRDHNLIISNLAGDFEWSVSRDGNERLLYGYLDWVYQEEVYGRGDFQAHWWSPDSAKVAFLRIDESKVKTFTVIDHVPEDELAAERSVVNETTNYPKAGDPNPTVRLGVAMPDAKAVSWVDLDKYADEEFLIVRVGWTPDGSKLVFQVQNRIQTWLDLNFADPVTGEMETVLHEKSESWVNVLETPRWLKDGGFLWQSERDGYQHIYRYGADGQLRNAVSRGKFPVSSVIKVDEDQGLIWFSGAKADAIGSYAYRAKLDGSEMICLTPEFGSHSIQLNKDGSFFVDEFSSITSQPEVRLCDANGEITRRFDSKPSKDMAEYAFSLKEHQRIAARDGFELDVTLIKPKGMDEGKSHPVWIDTYSGPNAPSVRNRWNYSPWHQFLAQNGIIVLQVNVRSASGRGQVTTAACYKQFGVQELADIEDAIAWVGKEPWADTSRVGIYGWSYGGFMTAYALTHSKAFRLGVAGAGVYDWQLYDTIYTERYMDTPQANAEGYKKTSVLEAAKDLSGHLVLLHGTMDDNVHFQNTVRFVYELQKADKEFDLMIYPKSRHGVRMEEQTWHMRKLIWKQISEHLLGES
ncbi:MAG: S9 family peptidase [Planctomycetota bacterium]|jgi:dipeptidyl-peptidase-4